MHASASQRAEALGLAQKQGILYPHQLPHLANGAKTVLPDQGLSPSLTRLLAGKIDSLAPLSTPPLTCFDPELDEVQQLAVARAVSTPDVFLLQGLPGTGKSRVLAEIIRQTAAAGGRTLFLAAHPASLDVVLQRIAQAREVFPIRYLDDSEKSAALPGWLRGLTLEEQRKAFTEQVLAGARNNRDAAEARCRVHRDEEPVWSELQALVPQMNDAARRVADLREQLPRLASAVEAEAAQPDTEIARRLAEHRQTSAEAVQGLDSRMRSEQDTLTRASQEVERLTRRIAELEPAYQARKGAQFWSPAFWSSFFNSQVVLDMESAQADLATAQAHRQAIEQRLSDLQDERARQQKQAVDTLATLVQAETQARQARMTTLVNQLEQQCSELTARWKLLCGRLTLPPVEPTTEAIEFAQQSWQVSKANDDEQCRFATQWTRFIEEANGQLAARLPGLANVVAASINAWQTSPACREAAAGAFDLLIIEDADRLTESELLKLAKHAPRCVLAACVLAESAPAKPVEKALTRSLVATANMLAWPRLAQTLAGEQEPRTCSWFREADRLVCQLVPLTKDDRAHLECEVLADAAEIELRILQRPRATPCLAQVAFPARWSFPEALAFIVREAEEVPIPPLGRTSWWREDSLRWHWQTAPATVRVHHWVEAGVGVRIGTVPDASGDSARLARVEFDKAAGWDRARAEAWLQKHRHAAQRDRVVFLQVPYRYQASLARTITGLIAPEQWLPGGDSSAAQDFEFCAVPAVKPAETPRDGAGLELDLAATRHVDRLPSDLRQGLPARGIVNYLEAQALVRRLESLGPPGANCRVAVLALYDSQVELLRRLIARSEALRSRAFTLEVSLPSRLHQHECDIVLLSLTRSHTHRCGAFGEDGRELPIALTRASSRLIVFGDAGMLARRLQWSGPLDHLDATSAQLERQRLSRLASLTLPVPPATSGNGK